MRNNLCILLIYQVCIEKADSLVVELYVIVVRDVLKEYMKYT
jgi:hypothetical protein